MAAGELLRPKRQKACRQGGTVNLGQGWSDEATGHCTKEVPTVGACCAQLGTKHTWISGPCGPPRTAQSEYILIYKPWGPVQTAMALRPDRSEALLFVLHLLGTRGNSLKRPSALLRQPSNAGGQAAAATCLPATGPAAALGWPWARPAPRCPAVEAQPAHWRSASGWQQVARRACTP